MLAKQATVAVVLSVILIMSAGCTGWEFSVYEEDETDNNGETQTQEGPAHDEQETTADDPETDQETADDREDSDDPPKEPKNEDEEIENEPAVPADETGDTSDVDEPDRPVQDTDDASETEENNPSETDENDSEKSINDTSKTRESDEEQLTCDVFDTQEDAQEYFDENPEERGYLDQNNNGIPCESLPSGDTEDEGDTGNDDNGEGYPALSRS